MTDLPQGISVGCTGDEVCVLVNGRGSFQNSQPLRRYALDRLERGYQHFTIDIGRCPTMDSTFLGVLAGIGLKLRRSNSPETDQVKVINVSAKNLELIRTLGLDGLLSVHTAEPEADRIGFPAGCQLEKLPESDVDHQSAPLDRDETTSLMISSHDNLIAADKKNEPKFKQVTKYLRQTMDQKKNE